MPEPRSIPFAADCPPGFFAQFPAAPAVFLLRAAEPAAEPYVSKTSNLRKRLLRLLAPPESQSKRLNLRERAAGIEYLLTGSDFESTLLAYRILRREFPASYQKRLRLRPAPLARLNLDNAYPRAQVTTRMGRLEGRSVYYGPFRSRALAERFLNESLDFFKIRRCAFDLNPDPAFPGCVYSEMKMCLAPCFRGCSDEAYAAEVERVRAYFDSGGASLLGEIEAERDRLSAALDFEGAAHQHAKMTKIKGVLDLRDELCHRLDQLDAVVVQPSSEPRSVALFRFRRGEWAGPEPFVVEAEDGRPLEARLNNSLEKLVPEGAGSSQRFTEELALLKRWFYRTHKTGEAFFANAGGALPVRRIANAVGRVYRGEKEPEPADAATPAGDL